MPRYIQVPAPAEIKNLITGGPHMVRGPDGTDKPEPPVPFAVGCRMAISNAVQSAQKPDGQELNVLELLELQEKCSKASAGDYLELSENEHKFLAAAFTSFKNWNALYILNALDHVRAILNAQVTKPAVFNHAPPPRLDPVEMAAPPEPPPSNKN